jgi:hypothetical protein
MMLAGRWKDTRMPMRWGKILAGRGSMARAAKAHGADNNCHMEVATDKVREATQSHASVSPVPGEHTDA